MAGKEKNSRELVVCSLVVPVDATAGYEGESTAVEERRGRCIREPTSLPRRGRRAAPAGWGRTAGTGRDEDHNAVEDDQRQWKRGRQQLSIGNLLIELNLVLVYS
jgi:hypothetical protein